MKIGRNDECHCGSGKKYKKCCMNKDATIEQEKQKIKLNPNSEWESEEEWEEDEFIEDYYEDDDYDSDDHNNKHDGYNKSVNEKKSFFEENGFNEEYPKISNAELKKIDDWYEIYKEINSADEFKKHLDDFLNKNSKDVIINLALEEEALFELISYHVREGKADTIIPYMIQFRTKYPEVYIRSYAYYDSDIIAWLISNNRTDEIPQFFNYFEKYPIRSVDKLFETINLMLATNNSSIALPLIEKNYKQLWYSDKVIGGYEIAEPLIAQIHLQFANENYTQNDIKIIVSELKKLELGFNKDFYDVVYWDRRINDIIKDYNKWDENLPKKKNQLFEKINKIIMNFTRFLFDRKNLDYATAYHYSKMLSNYYSTVITDKKLKQLFFFPKNQIDKTIVAISKDMFWFNSVSAYTILHVIYYFAEYLFVCGNYDENQKTDVQKSTIELAGILKKNSANQSIENLCFKKFPLF